MNNNQNTTLNMQERFAEIFSHLPEQDIEQFYAYYQLWVLRHRIPILEKQIEALREHIEENQQLLQTLQPPAIALAVLVRLQSNGVNDATLLDQMLDRGEDWLDQMMQRLDYCEQVEDFIMGDYNQWCINSLEGAYDWIDTMRGNQREETTRNLDKEGDANGELTEEILLQKLSIDDDSLPVIRTEQPPATLIEETPLLDQQPTSEAEQPPATPIEETPLLDQQLAAEEMPSGSIESEMLALFLNQGAEAEPEAENRVIITENISTAPWYSIELEEDEPLELNQVDWIKVLQADTVARIEAGQTEVAEYSVAEIVQPEEANIPLIEETVISPETTTLSADTEPDSTSIVEYTASEQNEHLSTTGDSAQIAEQSGNELTEAELVETQETGSILEEELNLSETEETTVAEEIESTTPEAIVSTEQEVLAHEDISKATSEIIQTEQESMLIEESHALLDVNKLAEENVAEEQAEMPISGATVVAELNDQTKLEETAPTITELTGISNIDELTTFTETIVNAESSDTSLDATSTDEPTIQEQASEPLETTGGYFSPAATEDEQPAWYEYLEKDPEFNQALKQEWQIKPEALPTALMWESKIDSVIDEQTQPMILREIKQASETQISITESQTAQVEDAVTSEPQEPLTTARTEQPEPGEEQVVLNTSQKPGESETELLAEEHRTLTSLPEVDDMEQTPVALNSVHELTSTDAQETVLTTVEAGQTASFEEETIQIQESADNEQSIEIVERIEEVNVVPVQREQPLQSPETRVTPTITRQEPPKKPGFWRRLFGKK